MGGNIWKHQSRALDLAHYKQVEATVLNDLASYEIEHRAIPYLQNKQYFGDLDIVVNKEDMAKLGQYIDLAYDYSFKTKSVYSCLFGNHFQVDFILVDSGSLDFACNYFSYNDLGLMLGKLAKNLHVTFGFQGLFYKHSSVSGSHLGVTMLTQDYSEALSILGLDPARFKEGFNSEVKMFEYVLSSPYVDTSRLQFDGMSNKDRVRDKKRLNYNRFLHHINSLDIVRSFDKDSKTVFEYFPQLEEIHANLVSEHNHKEFVAKKFNGSLVHKYTGLEGKALGAFLKFMKRPSDRELGQLSESSIKQHILNNYITYKAMYENLTTPIT